MQNNGKPMGVAVVALNSKEDADYVLEAGGILIFKWDAGSFGQNFG